MNHSQRYVDYISSKQWGIKKQALFQFIRRQHKHLLCQGCGLASHKLTGPIEVHHLHYRTLGNECVESDLLALCHTCHLQADLARKSGKQFRRFDEPLSFAELEREVEELFRCEPQRVQYDSTPIENLVFEPCHSGKE